MVPLNLTMLQSSIASQSLAAVQQLPISPIPWLPITIAVALMVMGIAALIYMLAPIINSSGIRRWAVAQVYEAALSIVLIFIFLGFAAIIFINPQATLSSAPLSIVPQGCTTANSIYTLSVCDLGQFNNAGYHMVDYIFYFTLVQALIPTVNMQINLIPTAPGINFTVPLRITPFAALSGSMFTYVADTILLLLLLSQVQLILLSSSLMLLSLFFTIGLVSRVFGVSRSFGGAMLAFGIGLGILFPLLTCMTYGFIDVRANTYCLTSVSCSLTSAATSAIKTQASVVTTPGFLTSLFGIGGFTGGASAGASLASVFNPQTIGATVAQVFNEIGYILAGLIFLPIFNVIIVDVFITDFSRAVGEQMSFSMLFQSLL